jgi:hypothetical protein
MSDTKFPPMFFLVTTDGRWEYVNIAEVKGVVVVGEDLTLYLRDGSERKVEEKSERVTILGLLVKLSGTEKVPGWISE